MALLGIPTAAQLTQSGIALEDHLAIQLDAVLNRFLDRISGTKVELSAGGFVLVVPPAPSPAPEAKSI